MTVTSNAPGLTRTGPLFSPIDRSSIGDAIRAEIAAASKEQKSSWLDIDAIEHIADQPGHFVYRLVLSTPIHVAPDQPAVQLYLEPGLEQDHRLAHGQPAGLLDDLGIVLGPVHLLGLLGGEVDEAGRLTDLRLDEPLELQPGEGQQRRDPLGRHVVGPHELLPVPFGQAEPQVALALLEADELRDVRGGDAEGPTVQSG